MNSKTSAQSSTFPNSGGYPLWIFGLIAALLGLVLFREPLLELVRRWSAEDEYSYGYLVPFITAWMLWVRRDALAMNVARPSWSGPLLVALATLVHLVGELSTIPIFSQLAFVFVLLGIVLAIGGFPLLKVWCAPIAFLIFAIPLPYFVNASLSLELELISSRLGVALIELFRVPVYLQGNVIDLGTYKLQVVEACSGLRYLFPLLSLSFLAAYLFQAPIWQRAIVLLSSIPITIAMNGFRIGMIGVAMDRWGPLVAEGLLHLFEGWIIFIACGLILLAEIYLLAQISGADLLQCFGFEQVVPSSQSTPVRKPFYACYACLFLIVAALFANVLAANRSEAIPERSRFITFPTTIGDWRGHSSLLDPQIERGLALDDYILSDYSNSNGNVVNLYVAYYSSQHRGKYHSPLVCIPGDGWSITAFERTSAGANHPMNRAIIERNGSKQLVYYWYEERGRTIASEYWSRWYLIYDSITINRSDGALVRLVTPILANELDKDADRRLRLFIHDLGPTLNRFLISDG